MPRPSETLTTRKVDWLLSNDSADWQVEVTDENSYLVCEVWNTGDGGGNFYAWHDIRLLYQLRDEALERFPDAESPMDALIESMLNAQENQDSI